MNNSNFSSKLIKALKYNKEEYSIAFLLLFGLSMFENFSLGPTLSLSDIIYMVFVCFFAYKSFGAPKVKSNEFYYIYPLCFLLIAIIDYAMFSASKMFMSQIRFVFNCFVFATVSSYCMKADNSTREKLSSTYIYVCVIASAFIIVQFLSFHLLRYNLSFDFGSYQGSINAASLAVPGSSLYRTGGFFKEPSWYAVFMGPSLDIAYKKKKIPELILCIVGLVLSTSSLGFIFLFVFIFFNLKSNRKYALLFIILIYLIYLVFPSAFERFFVALDFSDGAENSNESRVIEPFTYILSGNEFPLLGMDIEMLYTLYGERLFLNTFLFVLMSFGIVGMMLFLKMIWKRTSISMTLIILITVIIEGCYGRIDFWLPLIAATVFENNYRLKFK